MRHALCSLLFGWLQTYWFSTESNQILIFDLKSEMNIVRLRPNDRGRFAFYGHGTRLPAGRQGHGHDMNGKQLRSH